MICRTAVEAKDMCDNLTSNINRMFKADDVKDVRQMMEYAQERIRALYDYNVNRIKEANEG